MTVDASCLDALEVDSTPPVVHGHVPRHVYGHGIHARARARAVRLDDGHVKKMENERGVSSG